MCRHASWNHCRLSLPLLPQPILRATCHPRLFHHSRAFGDPWLSCMIFDSMNLLHLVDAREECLPSNAETVPSKWPTLSINSSIIFCCFLITSSDLLVWWFSWCWDVGAGGAGGVPLMLLVQTFLGVFLLFFVSYSSFILNNNFITSYVTICEISSNMIFKFCICF